MKLKPVSTSNIFIHPVVSSRQLEVKMFFIYGKAN